jgi:glyoxylase I family protein
MDFEIEHIGLPARDTVRLRDWYVHVFDAELVYSDEANPPSCLVKMPGGVVLEIYPALSSVPDTTNNKLSGWRHVALRVASIEAAKANLESRGVRFEAQIGPAVGGGKVLYFADAEGNLLHIVQRATA